MTVVPELTCAYRISRYDPGDRDAHGAYTGTEPDESDHGPVEDAHVAAVSAMLDAVGVPVVTVDRAVREGRTRTGMPGLEPDHGIPAYFGVDGLGFHDGAQVPVDVALELVRTMLRNEGGPGCLLVAPGRMVIEVGEYMYVYVGLADPAPAVVEQIRGSGLFVDPWPVDWFDPDGVADDPLPAGEEFWASLAELVRLRQRVLLQEQQAGNWVVWQEVDQTSLSLYRSVAHPGALLIAWPPLDDDLDAVVRRATAGDLDGLELVWRDQSGGLCSIWLDEEDTAHDLRALLHDATAAQLVDIWWPPVSGLLWAKMPPAELP